MSSSSLYNSRKRHHSPVFREDSDFDDDEFPPHKLRKKAIEHNFPIAIKNKLKSLAVWITDLPVKSFFTMAIRNGSKIVEDTIIIDGDDDDDDDIAEVSIQEGKRCSSPDLRPLIEKFKNSQKLLSNEARHCRRRYDMNGSYSYTSSYGSFQLNGSNTSNYDSKYTSNGTCGSKQLKTGHLKHPAIVSNPPTDIEILLDSETETSAPEADVIEILSESPGIQQKSRSQKSLSLPSKASSSKRSTSFADQSCLSRAKVASHLSSTKSFTANEVVRLQEKAQYKLLLEKYINGGAQYRPVTKKSQTDAGIQVGSDFASGSRVTKEVLHQPVDSFIQKYLPSQLVSSEKTKPIETVNLDDEDDNVENDKDDDIQIIDVKIPKFKPRYHCQDIFFSEKWLNELRHNVRIQTEERLKILEDQERKLERYKKERLLNRLKVDVSVTQAVEPEFPELTPEMEDAIDQAWTTGAPEDRLCKTANDHLLRKDFQTLSELKWLNDSIINSYFDLIVERSKQEGYPSIHAYNTYFYCSLKTKGYASVRRWTRKIDIFSFDLNFVPIHLGVHWCLAVIDHRSKKICYYDSMGTGEKKCLDYLHEYLILEYKDKKGQVLDPSIYTTEIMKDIPQQMNGSDCGMFTLKYAEYISRDAEITFSQEHMHYFRRRMVYELLTWQLL